MRTMEERQQFSRCYPKAHSRCTCGHLGDVPLAPFAERTEHDGAIGHGRCLVPGCDCQKFTWANFTVDFQEAMDRFISSGARA